LIFAKIEMMDCLPTCCDACKLQVEDGVRQLRWCAVLPGDKQRPMVTHMNGLRKRKNCPLRESFREIYSECVGMETSSTETFEKESRC